MFELTVITGPDKGRVYRLQSHEAVIGREENLEVSLTDRAASRRHARVFKAGRVYEIEDLGSGNGTLINADLITGARELVEGDLITIGKNTLRYHQHEEARSTLAGGGGGGGGDFRTDATITMRDLQRELAGQNAVAIDWDQGERSRSDMAAIFRVGQAFSGLQTTDDLYPRIIDVILAELPRSDRATLLLSEGDDPEPVVQLSQARKNTIGVTDTLYRHSLARTAMQKEQAMLIRDPVNDERLQGADTQIASRIRSAICVPVQTQVGLRGVMYADCVTDSAGFDEADLRLFSVIGLQAAVAIDNARLFEKLQTEKTALAEANARIKHAQQSLIQSEKLAGVGQLAAGVVHDIRNPIQVILGHAQVLLGALRDQPIEKCDQREFTEGLREIERGVGHINEIVTQLLTFARQSKPELRAVRLGDIASETLRFLQAETNKARVSVSALSVSATPAILADRSQIKQVIINMVMNAIQAMPSGGLLTVSSAVIKDEGRDMVSLSFADTGTGMTPEQMSRIFDPFYSTKTAGPSGGGTGLGLFVSYGIIESHGGRIMVDSDAGKGSCFTLLLPAHYGSNDDALATQHG